MELKTFCFSFVNQSVRHHYYVGIAVSTIFHHSLCMHAYVCAYVHDRLCCWLGGRKGIRPVKTEWWVAGVVICLEQGADLHVAQQMLLPLTVSCFSEIQIGFTFLVPAHPDSPGERAVKRVCMCMTGQRHFPTGLPSVCIFVCVCC